MANWTDYKNHVRTSNPEIAKDIDEAEAISRVLGVLVEQRHKLHLSQRDLARMCGIPQSSVARIEAGKVSPSLNTLLILCEQLGLALTLQSKQQAG